MSKGGKGDEPKIEITSYNQSGGITAGTVNVQAPQPQVHFGTEFLNRPTDEGYLTQANLKVDAPHEATALRVEAWGSSILSVRVRPPGASMVAVAEGTPCSPTYCVEELFAPLVVQYKLMVLTRQPDDLRINVLLGIPPGTAG